MIDRAPGSKSHKQTEAESEAVQTGPTLLETFKRIDSFSELSAGWNNGDGSPIDKACRQRAKALLGHLATVMSVPFAYPTPDGGVQLEWDAPALEIAIDPDGTHLSATGSRLVFDALFEAGRQHERLDAKRAAREGGGQ